MNDRFKFRCWNTIVKGFVPIIMNGDGDFSIDQNAFEWEYGDDWDYVWEKENNTLEQCTGLNDKNGKLIYEGDILGYFDNKIAVVWNNEYPSFELIGLDDTRYGKLSQEHVDSFGFGIIGNIHENEELLND